MRRETLIMIRYHDGQEVRLGDEVDVDGTFGIVFDIVEDPEVIRDFEHDGPSVGFRTKKYGEFYQGTLDRGWDETIVLLKRATA